MLERQAGLLSGGQQQMLALGRALMSKPKLLVLDEPSLGLAPLLVKRIYSAIAQLQDNNMSILLAEQNAKVALNAVNYAYVLETGQIVEQGSSSELKSSNRVAEIYLGLTK
jgi:branched-chain amino acid transport system ATP-binding protein